MSNGETIVQQWQAREYDSYDESMAALADMIDTAINKTVRSECAVAERMHRDAIADDRLEW